MKRVLSLATAVIAFPILASTLSAQVISSTWLGDGTGNFNNGNWSNFALWNPSQVPNNSGPTVYDVTIPYRPGPTAQPFNGPELDVDATVRNLTLVNGVFLDNQGTGNSLTVTGTTASTTEPGHDGEYAAIFTNGGTYKLGTLSNYDAATHSFNGLFVFPIANTTIGFRNADIWRNNGTILLGDVTGRLVDQDTNQNAIRNIAVNDGGLTIGNGIDFTTTGNFTNNSGMTVASDNGANTRFTVSGSFTNFDAGTKTLSNGSLSVEVRNTTGTAVFRFPNADIRSINNATLRLVGTGSSVEDSLTGLNGLRNLQSIQGGGLTNGGTLTITPNGGTLTNDGSEHTIDDGASITINGNLNVINGGTLRINPPTDNSSTVLTVNGSTLMAGTNQDMGGQPGVTTIYSTEAHFINGIEYRGAALTGTGTVYADILFTQNAYLNPGHSPGQLTLVGNVNLDNSITTYIQIGGTSPGDQFDQILQSGGLFTLHGTLDITVIDGAENVITSADTFDVITSSQAFAGNFDNFISGERLYTSDGIGSFVVTYTDQNKVTLSNFALVQRLTGATSRQTHGGVDRDIPLSLDGTPTVECRSTGGNYELVFTFVNDAVSGDIDLATQGDGNISGGPFFSGKTMTVLLDGVTNQQTVTVFLSNVTDSFAQVLPDTSVQMSILVGDTNGNGIVNASDVSQTKSSVGQAVSDTNFRRDVNVNGVINATDVSLVKVRSGNGLPLPQEISNRAAKSRGR